MIFFSFYKRSSEYFQNSKRVFLYASLILLLAGLTCAGVWYRAASGKLTEPDYCPPCECFPCWSCGNCPALLEQLEQLYNSTPTSPYPDPQGMLSPTPARKSLPDVAPEPTATPVPNLRG